MRRTSCSDVICRLSSKLYALEWEQSHIMVFAENKHLDGCSFELSNPVSAYSLVILALLHSVYTAYYLANDCGL